MDYTTSERLLKRTMKFLVCIYFIFIIRECTSDEANPCAWEETCGKCIQKDPRCAWCNQEDFTQRKIARCDLMENLQEKNCTDIVSPNNSFNILISAELSEEGVHAASAIQVKPLIVDIALRPNSPQLFSFEFRQAVPYPVDLYYLMDLSKTMQNHKEKLKSLGERLGREISKVSTNFSIGVGSFMDKVTPGYDSSTANTFPTQGFSFNSDLLPNVGNYLTKMAEVINLLKEIHDSEKALLKPDNLTGTLDVIMQAIVCKDKIRWRPDAKKLIVIATGNDFHYAGDGKLKGIIEPNDGECHLSSEGNYKEQDYPSLSQINRKIKEHNITIIFAVTDDQMEVYENISSRIYGSSARKLGNDDEILHLIEEQYEAMSSSIKISDNAQDYGNIEIFYNSTCLDGVNERRDECKKVKPDNTISFNVTMNLLHCPENPADWKKRKIAIQPVRRISTLYVNLEMICDCKCKDGGREKNVKFCSGNGTYGCGVCLCDNKRYGEHCECEGAENQTRPDISQCKRGKDGRICSNRGECRCGKCECYEGENPEENYYGKYCECSNFTCYRVNNKICNGHGNCECGKCRCHEGWSGPDCTCSNTTENCLVSSDGTMCSGHGTCYCGSCKCEETYYGQFCEDCPNCPGKCEEYGVCVQCVLDNEEENPFQENCNEVCKTLTVVLVDKMDQVNHTHMAKICSVEDKDGCRTFFKYEKDGNETTTIYAQRKRECPTPADIVAIVSGTIGSIVAAGLILLLLWKFLTYVHDKKEYAKFEKELKNAKWDAGENPFFIEPTSTFQNPAYRRN